MDSLTHHIAVSNEAQVALSDMVDLPPMTHNGKDRIYTNQTTNRTKFCYNPTIQRVAFSKFQKELPTYIHKEAILNSIQKNRTTMISAETGSGKSTQVAQYVMEKSAQLHEHCRIVCVLPRRIAVKTVAKRVAEERQTLLGKTVGYQVRLDDCTTPETSLIFMTRYTRD